MKWKTNWKKALRNGICVGTLLLFLFQFAAMAQEGGTAAQEEPSKISPPAAGGLRPAARAHEPGRPGRSPDRARRGLGY